MGHLLSLKEKKILSKPKVLPQPLLGLSLTALLWWFTKLFDAHELNELIGF